MVGNSLSLPTIFLYQNYKPNRMKQYKILLAIFILFSLKNANADTPFTPDQLQDAIASRGGRTSLESNKDLIEPNEVASLNIMLRIPPTVNQQTEEVNNDAYEVNMSLGNDPNLPSPYKATNWKIVQGGGTLVGLDDYTYSYTAPATAPPENIILISVDLIPNSKKLPKVVLLKTIYFSDNETAIVVNLPQGGMNNEKYINKMDAGVTVPTMQGLDPRVTAKISPELQAKMALAQEALKNANQTSGLNLSAATSNAMAIYDTATHNTIVKFSKLTLQMEDGKRKSSATLANLSFIFKGKDVGKYPFHKDNETGAGILIGAKGCGCGTNAPARSDKAVCNGYVKILSVDDQFIIGEINTTAYTTDGSALVKGRITGKFKARRTN